MAAQHESEPSQPAGAPPPASQSFLLDFLYTLRRRGVDVVPVEWFGFLEALQKGLARESLTGFYNVARATLVKSEARFDQFDVAFAQFFRNLTLPAHLSDALERWLEEGEGLDMPLPQLLDSFGEGLDLEELMRRFEEKLKEQQERHDGGSQWIGTHGTSPFGRDGVFPGGIRVGGRGGGGMAVQIAAERRFRGYRSDRVLDVRQVRVALRRLRDLAREGPVDDLDLDGTVEETGRNAGEIELVWQRPRRNRIRLMLVMDTGGSMEPHRLLVERLFSAANAERHWRQFASFYFHNCPYETVWCDGRLRERMETSRLLSDFDGDTKLVFVGDACMGWSELFSRGGAIDWYVHNSDPGITWLQRLAVHFRNCVWLNPMPPLAWSHPTVAAIAALMPMFELTVDGIGQAVASLKQER